jgi:hypothetical protein
LIEPAERVSGAEGEQAEIGTASALGRSMTTTMLKTPSRSFRWPLRALFGLICLGFSGGAARADLLSPCSTFDMGLIACAATDVGKPCQGGGNCLAVPCYQSASTPSTTMVYRCEACPTIISVPAGTCTTSNVGTSCGNGGTAMCGVLSSECQTQTGGDKYSCQGPPASKPTGPPAGEGGASSGCELAPRPMTPTAIGLGLVAAGLAAFFVDRARRRSR